MKYINNRDQFITDWRKQYTTTNEAFDMSGSGPMGNDINWGDSLVGRLINSAIRTTKIKYNATKIDNLLKDFKSQLDIILSESLSRDVRSEFLKLTIKSLLNDVDRTCTSTQEEKEKIKDLLGTDDGNSLWDPKKPNRGSFTENVNDGILLKIHDKIKLDLDEKQIEIAGTKKDDILASISDLIDNLREYAWSLDNQGSSSSKSKSNTTYAVRFWRLFKRRKKNLVTENYSHVFKLKGYYDFIKESNGGGILIKDIINIIINMYNVHTDDKEKIVKTLESISQKDTEDLPAPVILFPIFSLIEKQSESLKNLNYEDLYQSILNIHKNNEDPSELAKIIYSLHKNGNINDIDKGGKLKNSDNLKELFAKFKSKMSTLIKSFEKSKNVDKISSEKDSSEDYINSLINIEENDEEKIKEVVNKISLEKQKELLNKIVTDEESNDEDKKEAKELLSELESSTNESLFIKESISSNNTNVNEIWRKWIKDADIPEELISVSQQEIDKLEEMVRGERSGQNLMFNPKKTPDPIINIVRIFKRAHDLYYTDVISSGRSGGKVSNKTFREYEKLGTATTSQSDANTPGYGPWAVKSIRNKWVDGVMQIIEDQEYRKVFANIKFVVAGSEDTFNENYSEYINLILEKEEVTKSQGQILFDFITDMISRETASNFDKERNTLLKKYFGSSVEIKGSDMKQVNAASTPTKPQDPVDDKTLYWEPISQKRINDTKLKSDNEGPVIMFPYLPENSPNAEIFKFQVIKEITIKDKDKKDVIGYIIKTFDKVANTDFSKNEYKSFKVTNDDSVGKFDADKTFAVIWIDRVKITDISSGKKINIIFYNSSGSQPSSKVKIEVTEKCSNGKIAPSILYKKDKKEEQVNTKFNIDDNVVKTLSTGMEGAI